MGIVEPNLEVAAPADRVWEAVLDNEARPRWSPRVKEARFLDEEPVRIGTRVRRRIDRDRFTATVVGPHPYIRSGAPMPIRWRQRESTVLAASTSFSLAFVISSSPSKLETTRHCW